jgi:2-amino-4-hydroxy-6-hydroxymethyldihydropteridine diphosphokinase
LVENGVKARDAVIVVALGANLKAGFASLSDGLDAALAGFAVEGLEIIERSSYWRSSAWPDPTAPAYLNAVALVETSLGPKQVLEALQRVEGRFGRERGERNAPRTLDLDLVAYGRLVVDQPGLQIPHPRAHQRLFVMGPLAEIAPEWRHPTLALTARALAETAVIGRDASPL